jgi:hypothetical protein
VRQLQVCSECDRHVYVQDLTCPFCGSGRRDVLSARIPKGLSRAAAHAARAALILGAASTGACCNG